MLRKNPDEERILNRRDSLMRFFVRVALLVVIYVWVTAACAAPTPEILGIRLGMRHPEVKDILQKSHMPLTESSSQLMSVWPPPASEDGIKGVRFFFEKDLLYKIAVFFQIPEREPTAANLVALYARRNDLLTEQYGPPKQCIDEMKAPAPEQLHEWIARGRAYRQCVWEVPDRALISLWLYGEDSGIVLSTVYETFKKQ